MSEPDPIRLVKPPPPPPELPPDLVALWRSTVETWDLHDPNRALLAAGLQELDTYETCRAILKKEGPVITTPTGHRRPNPALAAGHASLRAFRQVLAALDLELPDPEPYPRARGSRSRGRR
jgi:phage terminase small subunit